MESQKKNIPKNPSPLPVAKVDIHGKLVSSPQELKNLYLETYIHRLRHRPIKPGLEQIKQMKDRLCELRLELVKLVKSSEWSEQDLLKVLGSLKKNKSRDPHNLVNDIFRTEVIGSDLRKSLLIMFNKMKDEIKIPEILEFVNIISIYKGKGKKSELKNDRGIFIINIFRSILMKLIYNNEYPKVDSSMSDSNIGARREKNIRNHLFIINGVINETIKTKMKSVDIEILDYRQCFDSMWLEEVVNDLYEAGVANDKLALIYEANKINRVSVQTPHGPSERVVIEKIVMQGETFAPLECSVQVDKIGKECIEEKKFLYFYKNEVPVPPLAMVDDLIAVSKCGSEAVEMNAYLNAKTNLKKLKFGEEKCCKMLIGAPNDICPELFIDAWKVEHAKEMDTDQYNLKDELSDEYQIEKTDEEKYLGDVISADGKNHKNIQKRREKGVGIIAQIMSILEEVCFGPFFFQVAVMHRNSLFLSSILINSDVWYNLSSKNIQELEEF